MTGTVARVTRLLGVLAEAGGDASLNDIVERLGLPASTTHRLLHLLIDQGFAERGRDARTYRAGLEFLRVGGLVSSRIELAEVANRFMQAVVDETGETCMLSLYVPRSQKVMIARLIHGANPLRFEAQTYTPSSLKWGATGRGILAFLPEATINEVLAREDPSPAGSRESDAPANIRRALAAIRDRGYAFTMGQKVPGAVGIAAPVYSAEGVVGALCVTLPEARFAPEMESRFATVLRREAAQYSRVLGRTSGRR